MLLEIPRKDLEKARDTSVDLLSFPVALGARRTFRPSYGMALRFQNTLHHQGTFYRRMQFPSYDPRLKIFADFDANQRLALSGARAVIGATAVAFHATDGVSSQKNQAAMDEFFSVIRKNHGLGATLLARLLGKWRGMKSKLNFS
ncbi:hypothetical protein [Terriglobus saanensis]|nr:hypothetical protein [Terriglobus saanensis]